MVDGRPELMTDPTPEPMPQGFNTSPSDVEFGPDPSRVPEMPKVNEKNPPRSARSVKNGDKNGGFTLGMNAKPRSGIPQLTTEDRDKIASLYTFAAMGVMPFKQDAAKAMAGSAEACADAWMELSKKNDGVRRVIKALVEGGAWGKVFAAHTPILLALLPANAIPSAFKGFDPGEAPNGE